MLMSEFVSKKIINLFDGGVIGTVGDSDLVIDNESGEIESIIVQQGKPGGNGRFRQEKRAVNIPWEAVRKVGSEVIVVDIEDNNICS